MSKYRNEISQTDFEAIERYLFDGMGDDERARFEDRMAADETFANEVALQRRLFAAVESSSFQTSEAEDQNVKKLSPYRWYAAAILLLGIVGLWFYTDTRTPAESDLFATYFHPDPGLPVVMSADTMAYALNDAMITYKEGKYEAAIIAWESWATRYGSSDTLNYFIGVAHLSLDNLDRATDHLLPVTQDDRSTFHEKALWYLALIKTKQNNKQEAIPLLEKLPHRTDAVSLLDALRND